MQNCFYLSQSSNTAASLKLNESFFPLYQGGLEENPDLDKLEKSSKVSEDVEEDNSDTEDVTTESDKRANEGGKKDPFLRRQELLVNSGLAEVGFARIYECSFSPQLQFALFLLFFIFYQGCFLSIICN